MAAIPASTPFTTTSGTATWTGSGSTGTISASNRAVLQWGTTVQGDATTLTNFNIAAGETFNFVLPSGGAVLNRVTAGDNTTASGISGGGTAGAIINGTLLSNGQVVVLSNGNIVVGAGAQISTASGLVLSTLAESDFNFTANGNLALNGASQGNIYLGTGATAASVIGNLTAAAGTITTTNLTVSGDLILNQVGSGTGLVLTGTGTPTTVGANFTATSNNGAITQGTGALLVANGDARLTAGASTIVLETATNDFKTLSVNTTGNTTGNVSVVDANIITLGASTVGQDLKVSAVGVTNNVAIGTSGTLTVGRNATFNQTGATNNSAINIGNNSSIGTNGAGTLNASTTNASFTFNGVGALTTGSIATGPGNVTGITVTTDGVLTVANNIVATGNYTGLPVGTPVPTLADSRVGSISLRGSSIVQTGDITIAAAAPGTGTVTLNATTGNITTGNITASAVTLNASAGTINAGGQNSSTVITTTNTTGTSSARASGNVDLSGSNVFVAGHVVQVPAASVASIRNTGNLALGTSNITGNATLNSVSGDVILGAGSGTGSQTVTIGGILTATVAGLANITDNDFSPLNIAGGLNLTTAGGSITLDAAHANGALAPNVQFGRVNANATATGVVSVSETTTLNLGNITAAALNARSPGGIVNSGDINVGVGTANFTTSGASTSVITNGTNTIGAVNFIGSGGAVTVASSVLLGADTVVTPGDDVVINATTGTITLAGATIGGSLTANSGGTIATAVGTNTTVGGSLSLIAANAGATSITQGANGRLIVTGETNITSSGNVVLTEGNDFIGGVVLNQAGTTGTAQIYDVNNLTVSGVSGGLVDARAGATAASIDNAWSLVLGNLNVGSFTGFAINGGAGNSGTITQAAGASLHSEGNLTLVTNNGNIVVANSGNSAGRVMFGTSGSVGGNGTATINYTEDGTLRVGNVAANSNVTLRSNFGSIIEDTNANVGFNVRATLNAVAPNGSILLGGTTNTPVTTTGNIVAFTGSAPSGAVAIQSTGDGIALGAINANSLTVTASNNITQTAALNVFGASTFTSTSTGSTRNISLTNSANNFGPVSVSLGNNTGTISVTEGSTLNLRRVTMLGGGNSTFTATSLNGDIIDTGLGGVRLGGNATTSGSGIVTLTATNGNITIDDPTSDLATSSGLVFNGKDVTVSVLGSVGSTLVLGASSGPSQATGNLTVSSALGGIGNSGAMTAGGNAFFQSPNGSIVIGQPGVGFGTLKFIGQLVNISESGNMDIATGSAAFGVANLVSGGSISVVNMGGGVVTFGSTVALTATGSIVLPKLVQAAGLMTVKHTGTADLSALSIAGDLGGITPVDGGTGTYVPPAP